MPSILIDAEAVNAYCAQVDVKGDHSATRTLLPGLFENPSPGISTQLLSCAHFLPRDFDVVEGGGNFLCVRLIVEVWL